MSIPSKAQFEEWLSLAKADVDYSADVKQLIEAEPITAELLKRYLLAKSDERMARWSMLKHLPAYQWASEQREFGRASRLVLSGRKKAAKNTEWEQDMDARVVALMSAPSGEDKALTPDILIRERLMRSDRQTFTHKSFWSTDVIHALMEYYYHHENSQRSVKAFRSWSKAVVEARRALNHLDELAAVVSEFDPY